MPPYNYTTEEWELWQRAITKKSFIPLLGSNNMLFYWQQACAPDVKRIATIQSHRFGKHIWCETAEKCELVEKFISDHTEKQIPLLSI